MKRKRLGPAFGDDGLVPAERHRDTRGELLVGAQAKLDTRVQFVSEIARLWRHAENSFVDIGRRLNEAKDRLEHGEFMAMVANDLPFEHRTANRLMAVARGIDSGALPVEQLPPSWATAYEVLTLTEAERQQAMAEGVIRPSMRRDDVAAFKRRLRQPGPVERDELAELRAEEKSLAERLKAVRARINEITSPTRPG